MPGFPIEDGRPWSCVTARFNYFLQYLVEAFRMCQHYLRFDHVYSAGITITGVRDGCLQEMAEIIEACPLMRLHLLVQCQFSHSVGLSSSCS